MRKIGQEYLDKFENDRYFTEVVEEFNKERTIENYINVFKVLQYRDFYLAVVVDVKDHHYRAEFKHTGTLPFEVLQDKTKVTIDPIKAEIKLGIYKEIELCIFTDPSKIDFNKMKANGMVISNLESVWEEYFSDEELGGIVINPGLEEVMVPYDYIRFTLAGEFDKIKDRLTKKINC